MKKIISSLIIVVLMMTVFYPVVYAIEENIIENQTTDNEVEECDAGELANNTVENVVESNEEDNILNDDVIIEKVETDEQLNQVIEEHTQAQKNDVIENDEKNEIVNVSSASYSGQICIDTPTNGTTYNLNNKSTIKISGWAVSNDSESIIKLYVNGAYWRNVDRTKERLDVKNAYSQYADATSNAGFEDSIDIASFPAGNHEIKLEEVSRDGESLSTATVKITVAPFTGQVCIDTPKAGSNFDLLKTSTVKLSGWAVSNDSESTIKLFVNGACWGNIDRTKERADVKNAYPTYESYTENAGFEYDVDITYFPIGTHEIKVEEVSRNGDVIATASVKFTIPKMNYSGQICIDTPTNGSTYNLNSKSSIKLSGWAVSNDNKSTIKLYVNGACWGNIDRTKERADVKNAYSQYADATPNAGFEYDVNISAFPSGTHEIKLEEVSRDGKVISTATVKIKIAPFTGQVCIDTPKTGSVFDLTKTQTVKLSGWAVSNDSKSTIKLYVNGACWGTINRTKERADVKNAYPTYASHTENAGFEYDIDISLFPTFTHEIKVEEVSRNGQVIASASVKFSIPKIDYNGEIFIESPTVGNTFYMETTPVVKLSGWAASDDANSSVKLYVNGTCWGNIARTKERLDVKNAYPQYATATPNAGFVYDIPITEFPEGGHTIKVEVVSRNGEVMASATRTMVVTSPAYPAMLHVEDPVKNKRYSSGVMKIKGWALSTAPSDYVSVYLDGVYQTNTARQQRDDVLAVYGGQFGVSSSYNAGFYSEISTAHLGEGSHNVKIILYSKYGRELAEQQIDFIISNTQRWGIDVSHHNGIIDWNAVKNSGVDFAIIKIGEYRESSGTNLVDDKFEYNYNECKRVGIDVGGYYFSYAFNATEAAHEADACTAIISGKAFDLPIFYDVESDVIVNAINSGRTNVPNVTAASMTFCSVMNNRGYKSGVYSYKLFLENYLNMGALQNYSIWLAQISSAPSYSGRYDLWQYSHSGYVAGIPTVVDLNWCYRGY